MGAKYHGQIRPRGFVIWPGIPATVEIGAVWGVGKKKSSYLGPQRRGDFADKNQTLGFSYRAPLGSVAGVKTRF